jgi:hypothetical protein
MAESPLSTEPAWSGDHVCDLLVRARKAFNGRALVVSGGEAGKVWGAVALAVDHPTGRDVPFAPGPLKVLHWLQRYASPEPRRLPGHRWGPSELEVMREYLRIRAHGGSVGSINEFVRAKGSAWSNFDRVRRRVCERAAADLVARGVPWFDLDERGNPVTGTCAVNISQVCA